MDVFVTREASVELDALRILRPAPSAWGLLIGHRRGPRFFVEKIFPAADGAVLPPHGGLDELDRRFGRKVVGVFAVRPGAALIKSLLGPYLYGRVLINVRFSRGKTLLKPFLVEFDRTFFLAPVPLEAGPKGVFYE
ncbi:MAG: hypothetical protein ACXVJK_04425 [Candidatus Aminicenantales bacterium]